MPPEENIFGFSMLLLEVQAVLAFLACRSDSAWMAKRLMLPINYVYVMSQLTDHKSV
jgi:hypothetical protein